MDPVRDFVFPDRNEELPWEKESTVTDRTSKTGRRALQFRADHPSFSNKTEKNFDYIHNLGADALRVQRNDSELLKKKGASLKHGTNRLIPKRVRVDDDGEDSVDADKSELSLDQDWSTISWNDEMVTSACETLYAKFQEPNFLLDEIKRTKAIAMFEKLVENNAPAEVFVKTNIEVMINSTTSRLLRGGRSISAFNFLYIIKIAQKKCCHELTTFRFAFKAVEMMLLESRLAAILIQHTFRSSKLKYHIKQSYKTSSTAIAITSETKEIENTNSSETKITKKGRKLLEFTEFGTDMEMRRLKERPIDARSADLRSRWRSVHSNKHKVYYIHLQ
jgi:hypothetical protein